VLETKLGSSLYSLQMLLEGKHDCNKLGEPGNCITYVQDFL